MSVTKITRDSAWVDFCDSERIARYWEMLDNRYKRYHLFIRIFLLSTAMAGVVTIVGWFPPFVQDVINALIAIAVTLQVTTVNAQKIMTINRLREESIQIRDHYKWLWRSIENHRATNEDVIDVLQELDKKLETFSLIAESFGENKRLNIRAAKSSNRIMEQNYKGYEVATN